MKLSFAVTGINYIFKYITIENLNNVTAVIFTLILFNKITVFTILFICLCF